MLSDSWWNPEWPVTAVNLSDSLFGTVRGKNHVNLELSVAVHLSKEDVIEQSQQVPMDLLISKVLYPWTSQLI